MSKSESRESEPLNKSKQYDVNVIIREHKIIPQKEKLIYSKDDISDFSAYDSPRSTFLSKYFFKDFIYLLFFREKGRKREREGKENQCVRDTLIGCSHRPPTGDMACNSVMYVP